MKNIAVEYASSLGTIVLAILAVFVFIYYGAHALFYIVVVVALFVGFLNAWLITKATKEAEATGVQIGIDVPKKRTAAARKRSAKRA